jgi:ATP-dependent Lhr-like helicase
MSVVAHRSRRAPPVAPATHDHLGLEILATWFAANAWTPFDFQNEAWRAYLGGRSGLIHAPTGTGKTLAAFGGPLAERLAERLPARPAAKQTVTERRNRTDPFTVLWLTPMRALANDTAHALESAARALGVPWSIELRTSDTTAHLRKKQRDRLPSVLVTTPESLSVLLSFPDARERMLTLRCAVVDEWHELLSTKRGVQAELGLARLAAWSTSLRVWGLSATIGNLDEAMAVLTRPVLACPSGGLLRDDPSPAFHPHVAATLASPSSERVDALGSVVGATRESPSSAPEEGWRPPAGPADATASSNDNASVHEIDSRVAPTHLRATTADARLHHKPLPRGEGTDRLAGQLADAPTHRLADSPLLIHAQLTKQLAVESLLPPSIERFPWAGHMGLRMRDAVIAAIEPGGSTLVFTNTRAQSEIWFRALLDKRPDWVGQLAIHHGSLDRKLRLKVESLLRDGTLKAVVCTSSLDLGVDFVAVDQVIQIGSPKGIARLMQRAGRSGHRPGVSSRVVCVPTHAFELIEFSAARDGICRRAVEARSPVEKPLDVLVQHIVTVASGGGFVEDELKAEVRRTWAYRDLSDDEWRWAMDFVERGGPTLTAYPQFQRVARDEAGLWRVASDRLAKMHRLSIGTITGDGVLTLVTTGGKRLGTIEESFLGKLKPGDFFVFAGRPLELLGIRQMTARVRMVSKRQGTIPQWAGGRFPMSTQLAAGVRQRIDEFGHGVLADEEMRRIAPLLTIQQRWSALPAPDELLIESIRSREGTHLLLYPFLGRLVHEGLGAVIGHRLNLARGAPVTATYTDYGIELLAPGDVPLDEPDWRALLSPERLTDDLLACLNAGELTRRQFREIARVAGLVIVSTPGAPRSMRQLQATSELFFDVFRDFDPANLLLEQARREVLDKQLEFARLRAALVTLAKQRLVLTAPKRFTPMSFPIWAQRIQSQTLKVEAAQDRIDRMVRQLEAAAGKEEPRMNRDEHGLG